MQALTNTLQGLGELGLELLRTFTKMERPRLGCGSEMTHALPNRGCNHALFDVAPSCGSLCDRAHGHHQDQPRKKLA